MINQVEYTPTEATPINITGGRDTTPPTPELNLGAFLLVSCHVRAWQASKKDKVLTDDAALKSGAADGRLRVQKRLMDGNELRSLRSTGDRLRDEILTRHSVASPIKGVRVMRATNYPKFTDEWTSMMGAYEQALNNFMAVYDAQVMDQSRSLGDAFDKEDYPTLSEVWDKFGVDLNIQPLTDPAQLTGFADEIVSQVSDTYTRMMAAGTRDVWKRSLDLVSNLATSLATAERLSQSHWDRLNEFTIDAPGLMPEADEEFNRHMAEIREVLLAAPKDLVRESPAVRETATAAVQTKLDQLKSKYQDIL